MKAGHAFCHQKGNIQTGSPAERRGKFINRQGGGGNIGDAVIVAAAGCHNGNQQEKNQNSFHKHSLSVRKFQYSSYHICQVKW